MVIPAGMVPLSGSTSRTILGGLLRPPRRAAFDAEGSKLRSRLLGFVLTRNCIICPFVFGSGGSPMDMAHLHRSSSLSPARQPCKVDDHIGSFARGESEIVQHDRLIQQALIGANLPEWQSGEEVVKTSVRAAQEAEAVAARFHLQIRPGFPIDHDHIPKELGVPERMGFGVRRRPIQAFVRVTIREEPLSIRIELPVLEGDLDLIRPTRKVQADARQAGIVLVPQEIESSQPA